MRDWRRRAHDHCVRQLDRQRAEVGQVIRELIEEEEGIPAGAMPLWPAVFVSELAMRQRAVLLRPQAPRHSCMDWRPEE